MAVIDMTINRLASLFLVVTLLLGLLAPESARAEGSLGTGGPVGERPSWPCPGCIVNTPAGYNESSPTPLLVTFHGDEGDPGYIHWRLEDQAASAGFLMLTLQCPDSLGCNQYDGSWWKWEAYVDSHDKTWVGKQVDMVEAEYNVELQKVHLAGFSGGASYMSWYAREFSDRFASVVYLAGGYAPYNGGCKEPCQIPAYFLIGSEDFLLDGAQELRDYYLGCGHDVTFDLHPGVKHEIIKSGLPAVMQWLGTNSHLCREEQRPPPPVEPGCTMAPDCDGCTGCIDNCVCGGSSAEQCANDCDPGTEDPPEEPPEEPPTPPNGEEPGDPHEGWIPVENNCVCSMPSTRGPMRGGWLLLLLGLFGRRRSARSE